MFDQSRCLLPRLGHTSVTHCFAIGLPFFTLFPSSAGACSHLTALRNDNVLRRLALRVGDGARVLNLVHHVHAIDDIAKYNVLAVEMGGAALGCDDEELATVGVGTCGVST
jgi:hypothetical protein